MNYKTASLSALILSFFLLIACLLHAVFLELTPLPEKEKAKQDHPQPHKTHEKTNHRHSGINHNRHAE